MTTPIISIRDSLHRYAASLKKTWAHDRTKTVGASEIGSCARKTWFSKHAAPRDEGYIETWGAGLRGTLIEDHFWVPGLRATLPEGAQLLFAGEDQQSLASGYLSATTDGLMVWPDGYCINLDSKSIDPRANLQKEKSEHTFQVQTQMGLIRELTEYRPETSIISYIDASFFDKIDEYEVKFDARIYTQAHVRATQIMTARDPLDMPPEGKMAGGDECKYCAWASHCANVSVAGVPQAERKLSDDEIAELKEMRDAARQYALIGAQADEEFNRANEEIKQFLRDHDTRRYRGDGWSVSYSAVNGKTTLDIPAIEAAGIDLKPFYKTGKPSERLTVK